MLVSRFFLSIFRRVYNFLFFQKEASIHVLIAKAAYNTLFMRSSASIGRQIGSNSP
jgi:hypothetical protein